MTSRLSRSFAPLRAASQGSGAVVAKEDDIPDVYEFKDENQGCLPCNWPAKPCEFQNFTVVKEGTEPRGPQKDYPELKYHMSYDTSKYRLGMVPEAFFNFMHERTGVLGPYMLLWGGAVTLLSKEILIFQEEFGAVLSFLTVPPMLAYLVGPKLDKYFRTKYNEEMMVLDKLKKSKIEQFSNEADALDEDAVRAEAGKEIFPAYAANAENMVEAEFRQRQDQVFEAFKRRMDYQVALQSLEEQVVQKQMVSWVKQEVHKTIDARSQKEGIAQCLKDLKALAATNVTI